MVSFSRFITSINASIESIFPNKKSRLMYFSSAYVKGCDEDVSLTGIMLVNESTHCAPDTISIGNTPLRHLPALQTHDSV